MKKLLIILLLTISGTMVYAQTSPPGQVVSFYPQYLLMKGIKAGMEIPLKNNNWLIISPEVYYSEDNNAFGTHYNELYGAGFSLHKKKYLVPDHKLLPYFSYEGSLNYFFIKDEAGSGEQRHTYNINKTGLGFTIGIQPVISDLAYLDIYMGVGFRKSFYNTRENIDDFRDLPWNYAYTGPTMLLGVKFCFITKP